MLPTSLQSSLLVNSPLLKAAYAHAPFTSIFSSRRPYALFSSCSISLVYLYSPVLKSYAHLVSKSGNYPRRTELMTRLCYHWAHPISGELIVHISSPPTNDKKMTFSQTKEEIGKKCRVFCENAVRICFVSNNRLESRRLILFSHFLRPLQEKPPSNLTSRKVFPSMHLALSAYRTPRLRI